jgi:hypothetical protein
MGILTRSFKSIHNHVTNSCYGSVDIPDHCKLRSVARTQPILSSFKFISNYEALLIIYELKTWCNLWHSSNLSKMHSASPITHTKFIDYVRSFLSMQTCSMFSICRKHCYLWGCDLQTEFRQTMALRERKPQSSVRPVCLIWSKQQYSIVVARLEDSTHRYRNSLIWKLFSFISCKEC